MKRLLVFLSLACVGCNGSSGSSSPAAPAKTPAALTIQAPSDLFFAGTTATLTGSVQYSDGSIGVPTFPAWRSDNSAIASIDASSGLLSAVKGGATTIHLTAGGLEATAPIRVVPNLQGTWRGVAQVVNCSQNATAAASGFCAGIGNTTFVLTLTQSRDTVQGSLLLGAVATNVTGSMNGAAVLTLLGSTTLSTLTSTLAAWTSQVNGNQMTGSFSINIADTGGATAVISILLSNVLGPN